MTDPPAKPPRTSLPVSKGPADLAEVERALSVLKGRHPEHERVRREDEDARARRQEALDLEARASAAASRKKKLTFGAVAVLVSVGAVVGGFLFRSEIVRRGRIEEATDPFRAMGFLGVGSSSHGNPEKLDVMFRAGCGLVVSTEAAPLAVSIGARRLDGPAPTMFCTCESSRVVVTSPVGAGGGLAILRREAAAIGGSTGFPFLPFKPGTAGKEDDACADVALDAWIDAKSYPAVAGDEHWLADPRRADFVTTGFHVAATFGGNVPLAVLVLPKDTCLVATSAHPSDQLTLRMHGGVPAAQSTKGLGFCTAAGGVMTVLREGDGQVDVLTGPAARAGGILGLRELVTDTQTPIGDIAVLPVDRAWDAKQLLVASAVPESLVGVATAPDLPPDPAARVVTVSFAAPGALTSDAPPDVFSFCAPALDAKTTESTCVFGGPQTWHVARPDAIGGLARAKPPFWLFALESASDPAALKVEVDLLAFARRMRRQGFEPTTLDAVTETNGGVDVLGRTGEDAVVAVGLSPAAPWVFPYSDGPTWWIEGAPRIALVRPLETVSLGWTNKTVPLPPKASRRTVVFRRQKR